MTSGERIEFSKEQPGRIYKESIIGTDVRVTGELDKAYMKGIEKDKKGKILRVWVSIPLSEVEIIVAKKDDLGKAFGALLGFGAFIVLVLGIVWGQGMKNL